MSRSGIGRFGLVAAFAIATMGVLAGCANRPTVDELANSILTAAEADPTVDVTAEEAQCIAARLLESDLSDTTLAGLADDFDQPEVLAAEADRVEPQVAEAAEACVS